MRLFNSWLLFLMAALAGFFLMFFFSCTKDNNTSFRNIEAFYYPLDSLGEGLVYEYELVGQDSFAPDLWFYRTEVEDSTIYLNKVLYSFDLLERQFTREQRVSNGMLFSDIYFFEQDSLGKLLPQPGEILSPNAFLFSVEDSTAVVFKVRFPLLNGHQTITTNRKFIGDTTFVYGDETIPAVYFVLEGEVDIRDRIEGDISPPFWGWEIYAKGLGLVEYSRITSPEVPAVHRRLSRIMRLDELEQEQSADNR